MHMVECTEVQLGLWRRGLPLLVRGQLLQITQISSLENLASRISLLLHIMALKMLNAEKQKKGRKMPRWSVIKVPKQPDDFPCGYYVMKYLSEIIESDYFTSITVQQE